MSELKKIAGLVDELQRERGKIAALELDLKKAQERERDLEEFRIPELMEAAGLTSFRTESGFQVELETAPKATITADKADEAYSWLEANGHGGLIKRNVIIAFNRDQEAQARSLVGDLSKRFAGVKEERKVHPSTLLAWVNGQLREGAALPLDLFSVHFVKRVKVARPK